MEKIVSFLLSIAVTRKFLYSLFVYYVVVLGFYAFAVSQEICFLDHLF